MTGSAVEQPSTETPEPEPTVNPQETSLEDVLNNLVHKIVMQPYGYHAAKFAMYPEKHTAELKIVELAKLGIWKSIVEIGQAKLAAPPSPEPPKPAPKRTPGQWANGRLVWPDGEYCQENDMRTPMTPVNAEEPL